MRDAHERQAFERLAEAMALVDANSDATELAHLLHARGVLYVEHGQLAARCSTDRNYAVERIEFRTVYLADLESGLRVHSPERERRWASLGVEEKWGEKQSEQWEFHKIPRGSRERDGDSRMYGRSCNRVVLNVVAVSTRQRWSSLLA